MRHHSQQQAGSVPTTHLGLAHKDKTIFKGIVEGALTDLPLSLSAPLDHIPHGTVTGATRGPARGTQLQSCSVHQVSTKNSKDLAQEGTLQPTHHFGKLYLPNAAMLKVCSHLCNTYHGRHYSKGI